MRTSTTSPFAICAYSISKLTLPSTFVPAWKIWCPCPHVPQIPVSVKLSHSPFGMETVEDSARIVGKSCTERMTSSVSAYSGMKSVWKRVSLHL
jgi:hypothetical protein